MLYDPETSPFKIPRQAFIDNFFCTPTKKNIKEEGITEDDVREVYEELEEEKREQRFWDKFEKEQNLNDDRLNNLIEAGLDKKLFHSFDYEKIAEGLLSRHLPAIAQNYDQIGGRGDTKLRFCALRNGKIPKIICIATFIARNEPEWNEASEELVIESSVLANGSLADSNIFLKFDGAEYRIVINGSESALATARHAGSDEKITVVPSIFDERIGEVLSRRKEKHLEEKKRQHQSYLERKAKEAEQAKKPLDRLIRAFKKFSIKQ